MLQEELFIFYHLLFLQVVADCLPSREWHINSSGECQEWRCSPGAGIVLCYHLTGQGSTRLPNISSIKLLIPVCWHRDFCSP